MLIPIGIFIALLLTPGFVFNIVFTNTFNQAIGITKLLSIPFILNPLGTIITLFLLYTVKKPIYILLCNISFFLIVSIGSYLLIPQYGMFGPPYAVFLAFAVAVFIQAVAAVKELKKFRDR